MQIISSIRFRLLISYVLLLGLALAVISVATILFLTSQAAPPEVGYNNIARQFSRINLVDFEIDFFQNATQSAQDIANEVALALDTFASQQDARLVWLFRPDRSRDHLVIYDTDDVYLFGDAVDIDTVNYRQNEIKVAQQSRYDPIFGTLTHADGGELIFGGVRRNNSLNQGGANDPHNIWAIVEAPPTQSIRQSLTQYGSSLLIPIIQAGVLGIVIAVVFALLISRSFTRPLQWLLGGVQALAQGNYDHRIPEQGASELRDVARGFNRMAHEVQRTRQAERDFLANVSHDLKTPLTSIQGYSQAIVDGATPDPAHAASIIYDEAGRLNRMVIELTDLVRIQSGQLSMNLVALNIDEIIRAIGDKLMVVAQQKQVDFQVRVVSTPMVMGDGDRLVQVITNLISNAIKYTPADGQVWVDTRVNGRHVEVVIQDTGVGISPEELPRVFERFYQVDKARGPQRGIGLGLAISQEIVQAHGGEITVDSLGVNQGSTFILRLPIALNQNPTQLVRKVKN